MTTLGSRPSFAFAARVAIVAIFAMPSAGMAHDAAGITRLSPFVPTLQAGDVVPETRLVDQLGRPLSLRGGGAESIVTFAYTRCSDARGCSLVTAKFTRLQPMLRGTGIRLVELTLDPAFDLPAVLQRYAAAVGADAGTWVFGTGRPADVIALSERFGILRTRGPRGVLGHTEALAIVSPGGAVLKIVDGDAWSPRDVAAEARADAGLRSNPIDRVALLLFARVSAACGGTGANGVTLAAALTIFALCLCGLGYLALRVFSTAFIDRS